MQTQTKAIISLIYAIVSWAGVPLPSYAVDLLPQPRGGETWQTTTSDGVTVRTGDQNAIAHALAQDTSIRASAPAHVGRDTTKNLTVTVTAYNSVPAQTDDTPCVAADGSDICKLYAKGDYSCASALPFGTKLDIPGFGVCTVRDRLAPKYSTRIDLHMGKDITRAMAWGKRQLTVTIINK